MKKLLLSLFAGAALSVTAQSQVDLPITFDDPNLNYATASFGNAADSIIADPTDPTNTVLRQTQPVGPESWAGTTVGLGGLANPVPFAAGNLRMSVRVWSPNANIPVRLKVEDANDPTIFMEVDATVTTASTWETLTFDFGTSVVPFNPANTYNLVSVFCDFGNTNKNGEVYYIDDIMMIPPPTRTVDLPITFEDTIDYNTVSFGNAADTILVDPTDASNMVLRQTQPVGPEVWAGTTIGEAGLINPIAFSATETIISGRVWSVDTGVPILLKVEDASDATIFAEVSEPTTVSNGWSYIEWDLSGSTVPLDFNNTYDKLSIFCDFGNANKNGEVYYIDDIVFGTQNIGIEARAVENLAIAPNPSNGSFKISGTLNSLEDASLRVVNMQGQVFYSQALQSVNLNENISLDVASGVYLVQVKTAEAMDIQRIVVQ